MNKIVLSLGGSIVVPEAINVAFIRQFKKLILPQTKKNQFFIIVGGGRTCRLYQQAAQAVSKVSNQDLDLIGIQSSRLNAELVKSVFGSLANPELVVRPDLKLTKKKLVVIGAGWKPGRSTDYMAIMVAIKNGVRRVVNLSNIEYVYDRDPRRYKQAKKIKEISWPDFRRIVGQKWSPGLNVPFDPIASRLAQKHGIEVIIAKGTNLANLKKIFLFNYFRPGAEIIK